MKLQKSILSSICLCLGLTAGSQTLDLSVSLPDENKYEGMRVFLKPVNQNSPQATVQLTRGENGMYEGSVSTNTDGLYYLYTSTPTMQTSLPIYIPASTSKSMIGFRLDGYVPSSSLDDDANKALSSYTALLTDKSILLGTKLNELSDSQVKAILKSYMTDADSIANLRQLPEPVRNFMNLWAYTAASDAVGLVNFLSRNNERALTVMPEDILPEASTMLDSQMAASFPSAASHVATSLPKGTLEERLAALHSRYKTPEIKTRVTEMLIDSFLRSFDYSKDFENGEARLTAIIDKYNLPQSYLDTFRARKATIAGTPFPAVSLVARDGNPVDFSKFRGKYVYVDLWASWCGPCCREVPHLQQLEKEMDGSDVVFVSISTDSSKEPWIKKMDQLSMHGNQLWNNDGNLTKQLNISGIPHFLIYDPEGRLHTYKASRPSDDKTRPMLESLK